MAIVEWWWFDHIFAGSSSPEPISTEEDRDADFNDIEPARAMADLDLFQRQCDVSRAIVADAESFDDAFGVRGEGPVLPAVDHDPHDRGVRAPQRSRRPAARADRRRRGGVSATNAGTAGRTSPGVKFSIRQILASTVGAVIAAVIASDLRGQGHRRRGGHRVRRRNLRHGVGGPVDRARSGGGQAGGGAGARLVHAVAQAGFDGCERRRGLVGGGLVRPPAPAGPLGETGRPSAWRPRRPPLLPPGPPGPPPRPPSGLKPPPCRCRRRERPGPARPVCCPRSAGRPSPARPPSSS